MEWIPVLALIVAAAGASAAWFTIGQSRRRNRAEDSAERFRSTYEALRARRSELTQAELDGQSSEAGGRPRYVLSLPGWLQREPIGLEQLTVTAVNAGPSIEPARAQARKLVDFGYPGERVPTYSSARKMFGSDQQFWDGQCYRLLRVDGSADDAADGRHLTFTTCSYFDAVDTTEVLGFEAAMGRSAYRSALGDPFRLDCRAAVPGVVTLTIVLNDDGPRFLMHDRKNTGTAPGSLHAVPAGEFQPIDATMTAVDRDLDVWSTMCREYAEELLGHEESAGRTGWSIDWNRESPYRELALARASGAVRPWYLGVGLDPLTWKPDLLTVCVFDSDTFWNLFPDIRAADFVEGSIREEAFTEDVINRYIVHDRTLASGRAVLDLAWRSRDVLLAQLAL